MAKLIKPGLSALLTSTLLLTGCGIYQKYGYGHVTQSKRDAELPPNAPSNSQRFNPATGPANAAHRGFDFPVPTRPPVLAATDGIVSRVSLSILYGKISCFDRARACASAPVALTHPVPCGPR